ncbi:hypothetical protein P171DRAFT_112824 [Karstenula rhodostoma CBS 690.94]|uniref:Uncharacterized protein n=1 Tax=Karstenula rhodostoma CBS 690.94 TaxID=1392251 RepID=A0A9P4P9I3_9PLEO|nr:hypothetical protein P171DRAFT_112824 [Karstenula rhodostoma CBS 690.94]
MIGRPVRYYCCQPHLSDPALFSCPTQLGMRCLINAHIDGNVLPIIASLLYVIVIYWGNWRGGFT